jgi:hypothetical protein
MLGLQPAYLRRVDTHDVVRPSRSTGRQRRYSRIDIDRIGAIPTLISHDSDAAPSRRRWIDDGRQQAGVEILTLKDLRLCSEKPFVLIMRCNGGRK